MFTQPLQRVGALILVVESIDRHHILFRELHQQWMLVQTGHAPGRPDVEYPDPAFQIIGSEHSGRLVQLRQPERGRRLVDQRRGNFARVQPQPRGQEYGQHQKNCQWQKTFHCDGVNRKQATTIGNFMAQANAAQATAAPVPAASRALARASR